MFSAYGGGGHYQWGVPGGLRAGHGDGGATVQVKGVPGSLRAGQGDGGTTGQVKGVPGGLRASYGDGGTPVQVNAAIQETRSRVIAVNISTFKSCRNFILNFF